MSQFAGSKNFSINHSTFHTHQFQSPKSGFERLQEHVAHGAFHDSGERFDPPKCHQNTRVAIIKRITDWIDGLNEDTREALVMWLYGPAGAGKSAIAQTIAEMLDRQHYILSSFFFSRNDPQRGTAKLLVTSLAYQLAVKLPHVFRDRLGFAFENDPLITTRSLEAQFKLLVKEPLLELFHSGFSTNSQIVVIIDGLDECHDSNTQAKIVDLACNLVRSWDIPMKILMASRPEVDISMAFDSKPSYTLTKIGLESDYQSNEDIRRFLTEKLRDIKTQHPLRVHIPKIWPASESLNILVKRSSGQFIYASTVAKYVASPRHRPMHRLEIVLGIRPLKAGGDNPFAELDALYRYILMGVENLDIVLKIIGCILFYPPRASYEGNASVSFIESLFSLDPGDVQLLMQNLGSLVFFDTKSSPHGDVYIRISHASLKDYVVDQSRSKDLFLDPSKTHTYIAELCSAHINTGYKGLSDDAIYNVFHHIFHHYPLAESTPRLVADILSLSLSSSPAFPLKFRPIFLEDYFHFLNRLKDNWEDLEVSRIIIDETIALGHILKSQLDHNLPHLHVSFLFASIKKIGPIEQHYSTQPSNFNFTRMGRFLASPRGTTVLVGEPHFIMHFSNPSTIGTILYDNLQQWITSSQKPNDTPSVYANAALFSLHYVTTSFPYAYSGVPRSLHYLRTRSHSAAQSRWYRRSLDLAFKLYHTKLDFYFFVEGITTPKKGNKRFMDAIFYRQKKISHIDEAARHSFMTVMSELPHFLETAGHSEELIAYARHHPKIRRSKYYIELLYPHWEKDEISVNNAIKTYLKRVEGGQG